MRRRLTADEVAERIAWLTRRAHELEAEAKFQAGGRDSTKAAAFAAEAAAIRRERDALAEFKFRDRARPRTVTFERDPKRLVKVTAQLDRQRERTMTRHGVNWLVRTIAAKWMQALDDLLAVGKSQSEREADELARQAQQPIGLTTNRHSRIH